MGISIARGSLKPSRDKPPPLTVFELENFTDCKNHATTRLPQKLKGHPLPVRDQDAKFIPSQCPKPVIDFSTVRPPKKIKFNLPECARIRSKPKCVNYVWSEEGASKDEMLKQLHSYHSNKETQKTVEDQKTQLEEIALTVREVIKRINQLTEAQEEFVNEQAQVKRPPKVRRQLHEGSYPNLSVKEEAHLPHLLRFSWKGKIEKLEAYLKSPQNRNKINLQVDSNGRTALHFVASWGDEKCVEILLRVPGINLDLQDSSGMTALFKAAQIQSFPCVKALVEAGSNPLISCKDGRNVLEYTIMEHGDKAIECIRYLYSLQDLHKVHAKLHGKFTDFTLLHRVCLSRAEVDETLQMLMESMTSDLDTPEGDGLTPLFVAVIQDRLSLVKALVKNGADVEIRDKNNKKAKDYSKSEP